MPIAPFSPCRDVPTVSVGMDLRERVAERLGSSIPEDAYLAFIEPYEGMKHLEAIRAALDPAAIVAPREVRPLRMRIVAFPDDLPFSENEAAADRALHRFMTALLSGRSEWYVRQMALHQRRKELLNLLWVFARYGEPAEENGSLLVISSQTHCARDDFRSIVRKRDNSLRTTASMGIGLLDDFGVRLEHIPVARQAWQPKMSFDHRASGPAAMQVLKDYVTRLVEDHGFPQYAGSSRFEGEAYARFSKADMRDSTG